MSEQNPTRRLEEKTNGFDIKEETKSLFDEEKKEGVKNNLYY